MQHFDDLVLIQGVGVVIERLNIQKQLLVILLYIGLEVVLLDILFQFGNMVDQRIVVFFVYCSFRAEIFK